ncbi:MAG: hypothetical protein U0361_23615 [Nitrospiraceae bacterium]
MPQPVGSAQALVMSGEDLLIHLTAYSVLHRGHLSESFMQDLSQLTRTVSLDWDRILQDSASWDLQMPLRHAFTTALANRPEPLIPDWVLSRLTPASQRDRLWLALLSRLVTGPPIAEVGHLLLLLSQPSGRRWCGSATPCSPRARSSAIATASRPHISLGEQDCGDGGISSVRRRSLAAA